MPFLPWRSSKALPLAKAISASAPFLIETFSSRATISILAVFLPMSSVLIRAISIAGVLVFGDSTWVAPLFLSVLLLSLPQDVSATAIRQDRMVVLRFIMFFSSTSMGTLRIQLAQLQIGSI
jgi:hypothetical protein